MCLVMKVDNHVMKVDNHSQFTSPKKHDKMNLLLITKDEKKHYVLVKDFNSFMYNQTKHKEMKRFCMYCLQCFSSETSLSNHINPILDEGGGKFAPPRPVFLI